MFRRGRRLFAIASLSLVLAALLHTLGQLLPRPADPALMSAVAAMRGYTFDVGLGMSPSLWDIQRSLTFTMSVLLLSVAALNLALAKAPEVPTGLLRRCAGISALGVCALVAIYAWYRVPPPLLTLAPVAALFVAAWLAAPKRS